MNKKSKTILEKQPDIEVVFKFNGTRKSSVVDGYRPAHLVTENYLTTGVHHYYQKSIVPPDGTAKGTITFLTPEEYPHCLWVGKEINIQEGERIVGCAVITKIFNQILCSTDLNGMEEVDFNMGIDQIFEMLSWSNDERIQKYGIIEAQKIKSLSVFMQPRNEQFGKDVWENCAKVLESKTDKELQFYLFDLFKWLQDMNWPGSEIVYERLQRMPIQLIETDYKICLSLAERTGDTIWKNVLVDLYKDLQCSE